MNLAMFIILCLATLGGWLFCIGVAIWMWNDTRYGRDAFHWVAMISMLLMSLLPFAFLLGLITDVIAHP